jgi:SAM-dependent methyltransferase
LIVAHADIGYDRDLRVLKRSFVGGGEGAFYFRMLERLADRPHLDWLDIGVGRDGGALQPFAEFCRSRKQSLAITGIDPDACAREWNEDGIRWTLIRSTFESWRATSPFDVVNADQSLYYFDDLECELRRAIGALKPGGLFIATCWSRDDALHRIRERLFQDARSDLVAEDLVSLIECQPDLEGLEVVEFRTAVRLGAWRADPAFLEPAVRVIARSAPCADVRRRALDLAALLPELPLIADRINLALCAHKRRR